MKKVIVLIAFLVTVSTMSFARPKQCNEAVILSNKNNVVYFKVDRSFIGGTVEIYDANKNLMEGDMLTHTHTMVYFDEMPAGHYIVRVTKDAETVEFGYDRI